MCKKEKDKNALNIFKVSLIIFPLLISVLILSGCTEREERFQILIFPKPANANPNTTVKIEMAVYKYQNGFSKLVPITNANINVTVVDPKGKNIFFQ